MLRKVKDFILKYRLYLIVTLAFVAGFFVIKNTFTLKTSSSVWDGTVASSFAGGNGTIDNPYVIKEGSELAYFFSVINSDNNTDYFNKFYILDNNINLNGYDFSFIQNDKLFSGSFDGQGYNIFNFNLDSYEYADNIYYSLFGNLNNAEIMNINIYDVNININETNANTYVGLLGINSINSNIHNLSLYNINLNNICDDCLINSSFGIVNDLGDNNLTNINISGSSSDNSTFGLINNYSNSTFNNIIYNIDSLDLVNNYEEKDNITLYKYEILNNKIKFDNDYTLKTIKESLDKDSIYEWDYTNLNFKILNKGQDNMPKMVATTVGATSAPSAPDTGISGTIVNINDYDTDYNYYMGLNFSTSSDNTIPSMEDKEIYSDSNLVYVNTNYYARDIDNRNTATVSLTENQNQYSYYNVYSVNKNGTDSTSDDYIEFDLIQNPFTNRPTDMGFNGWVTDYTNAYVTLDIETYTRKVRIPVSYSNGVPTSITINFYASWTGANVAYMGSSTTWSTAQASLQAGEMNVAKGTFVEYESVSSYYVKSSIGFWESYPDGALRSNTRSVSGRCWSTSCEYYILSSTSTYDPTVTYYKKGSNSFTQYTPQVVSTTIVNKLTTGAVSANYFIKSTIINGNSVEGYYDISGNLLSGNCSNSAGCTVYDIIPYKDENGNVNVADASTVYYYLVTRDTNIVVLNGTNSNIWSSSETKPFTLTSVHNGTSYKGSVTWNVGSSTITAYSDINIENIVIQSRTSKTSSTVTPGNGVGLVGNYYNIRMGRGISQYSSYVNLNYITGGNTSTSTGSSSNLTRYSLIVESGVYNAISCIVGTSMFTNYYVKYNAVFGNDYDRITNNNSNLNIVYCLAGTFGGLINSANYTDMNMVMTIKSGSFGSNNYNYTTGIYVGGRGVCSTNVLKKIYVQGGEIYNLIGEPAAESVINNYNAVTMYITGGTINMIYGGAGETETDGNRVIQMTGGTVNYSVFGGSNGHSGGSTALNNGQVNGDSYIYIGGNAIIGNETLVNANTSHSADEVEAGSVFGVGNGNSNYETIGTMDNAYIIIDGNAKVLRNVYGGGNYGATGYETSNSQTKIKILGGTISGSVYAGGNNNGAGASSYSTSVNIAMSGGNVTGSIYGGSRTKGIIYGDTTLDITGGTISNNVFGGGEGGYSSSSNYGTYVKGNVTVNIGLSGSGPTISGNVYGGSAYGTVNAYYDSDSESVTTSSGATTTVNVNGGKINGAVFGGAKGDNTYTPYVKGNITVNINDGVISYVYGGFDAAGTPEGTDYVYLNGGTIGSAYGGGASTSITTSNIYLQGATVTYLYGGSDQAGTVTNTNVNLLSGNVTYVYGGNNAGGTCATTSVVVKGGTINTIYGGGNVVDTTTTNVNIYNNDGNITYVYGGGNQAGVTTTNITALKDTTISNTIKVKNMFGGSNKSGTVTNSNIIINQGNMDNIYGGNNAGGSTTNPYITINAGKASNVYGGGNKSTSPETHVIVNGGTVGNLYGGGRSATVTTTNVTLNGGKVTNAYGGGREAGCTTTNITGAESSTVKVTSLYGGSNTSGNIVTANVIINSGTYTSVYGGNNAGGITSNPLVTINGGTITSVYGGGNLASVPITSVTVNGGTITNVFGGGKQAIVSSSTYVYIKGGTIKTNVYGGGDEGVVTSNTYVYINNGNINGSAYAGGNGASATVNGNTNIYVGGSVVVGSSSCSLLSSCSVFGGGNAAYTGTESANNSNATVSISGGTIYGNVYGGANTSKVYGTTKVLIGANSITNDNITKSDINISGTVFGGGEANAAGSTTYDYNYISVTNEIDVDINGTGYNINITGSVFGSGNASSTSGISKILISNYGVFLTPKHLTSIQRTDNLIIDNSSIALSGAADRTNDYSDVLFTLSLIEELNLKNNSTLYLETTTNLLKKVNSITSDGTKAAVTIDKDAGTVTKNVDNRIYMYEGKNLNIATNPNVTAYGEVNGMTFFGLFNYNSSGNVNVGIYNDYDYDEVLSYSGIFTKGSYVLGAHKASHDITVDGFYTNYMDDDTLENKIDYIETIPEDAAYYMWIVGELVAEYDIELVASKYATLGAYEFSFTEFTKANTSFQVLGFDTSDLADGINLVNKSDIPKLAQNETDADTNFALTMESTNSGWLTSGVTTFYSNATNPIGGTTLYEGENSASVPTMLFYLYHSKNIATTGDMGTVRIILLAITKTSDLESETKRIVINVELSRLFSTANDYEASLTSGKKYEMFSSTLTNISNKSSLSAYFSLYADGASIYRTGYHRSLVSNVVLPLNTKITMIDLSKDEAKYYYHVISSSDVTEATNSLSTNGEIYYDLSMFEVMGASGSGVYYSDSDMNNEYYNSTMDANYEEFIFIIDFKDTSISADMLNNQLLFEMHDEDDETIFGVLGIQRTNMYYNVYNSGDAVINLNGSLDDSTIYNGDEADLNLTISYAQTTINNNIIYDTQDYDYKLGTKISLINSNNETVSGTSLLGLYYEIDGIKYYPNIDGTTRIKIADRVGNVAKNIKIHTGTSNIATGTYTLRLESYASPDGIYYGIDASDTQDLTIHVVNEIYGLDVSVSNKELIIDKTSGYTLNNSNSVHYTLDYNSGLTSPSIRLKMSRRKYDSIYSSEYETVNLGDYVSNTLASTDVENEYLIISNPNEEVSVTLLMKNNLLNGTYKMEFILYDGSQKIGSVEKYLIIK